MYGLWVRVLGIVQLYCLKALNAGKRGAGLRMLMLQTFIGAQYIFHTVQQLLVIIVHSGWSLGMAKHIYKINKRAFIAFIETQ